MQAIRKFGTAGMQGIYMIDTVARTIGWNAVYRKVLADGGSEAEAIRAAQNTTLRTQPTATAKDLPQLYVTNEFANWFTMFTNQLNQIYNIGTYDIPSYVINKQYGKAALGAIGMGVTALTIWAITNRDLPDEPEDVAEALTEQAINATPLIGKAIMVGRNGWGDKTLPALKWGESLGDIIASIEDAIFKDEELELTDSEKRVLLEGIAILLGLPYIGPKRVIEAVQTGELGRLLGGKPQKQKKKKGVTNYPY